MDYDCKSLIKKMEKIIKQKSGFEVEFDNKIVTNDNGYEMVSIHAHSKGFNNMSEIEKKTIVKFMFKDKLSDADTIRIYDIELLSSLNPTLEYYVENSYKILNPFDYTNIYIFTNVVTDGETAVSYAVILTVDNSTLKTQYLTTKYNEEVIEYMKLESDTELYSVLNEQILFRCKSEVKQNLIKLQAKTLESHIWVLENFSQIKKSDKIFDERYKNNLNKLVDTVESTELNNLIKLFIKNKIETKVIK